MAKRKVATAIKKSKSYSNADNETDLDSINYYEGPTQSLIPVKDIVDGFVQLVDGRYIGYIEILPMPFDKLPSKKQNEVVSKYKMQFSGNEYKFSLKILSDTATPIELIRNIQKNCKNKDDPNIQKRLNDHIAHVTAIGNNNAVMKRFFYSFEYRSDEGRKNGNRADVIREMHEIRNSYISLMRNCGNICVELEDRNMQTLEFLYLYFNRNTARYESLQQRYDRLSADYAKFNEMTGQEKELYFADLIATKGVYFDNRNYIMQDGMYVGYLGILGNSWPSYVEVGWFDIFDWGASVDIDVVCKKMPYESTMLAIKGVNKLSKKGISLAYNKGRNDRADSLSGTYANNKIVYDEMKNNHSEMYDVGIILTLRAATPEILKENKRIVTKALKKNHIHVDDSFLFCEDYYWMTMPFLYITKPFKLLRHNTLAYQLATTYCFSSNQIYDPKGCLLGLDKDDIIAVDIFNTERYKNANMVILGTSGAGKTFTEQVIGSRMLYNGIRCYFIIPKKGYEYERGCRSVNGSYIKLNPGSEQRINIMEIKPEGIIDESKIDDGTIIQKSSWRSKKINNVITWIQLLLDKPMTTKEYNALNRGLVDIYESYGITEKNESIFEDISTGKLKIMPIIEDVYNYCGHVAELENIKDTLEIFVYGNCANMNGQTNVDLNNNYTVYDVDEDEIGEKLLASFLFVAFDHVYTEIKSNDKSKDIVCLDEVWKMLKDVESAKQVQNMVKLVRGYGGSTIMATQEIADFMRAPNGFGKSVLNNSEMSLILNMKSEELDMVKGNLKLEEDDCKEISMFNRGQAMFISNGNKLHVNIKASELEKEIFSTDINDRLRSA